jgi:TPR repeat protein
MRKLLIISGLILVSAALVLAFVPFTIKEKDTVASDVVIDVKALQASAEKGDAKAQVQLAQVYMEGKGVTVDFKKAYAWFSRAADQGNLEAYTKLGEMYEAGCGVPVDGGKAVECFKKAAEKGYVGAQFDLGQIYAMGTGIPADQQEAVKWFKLAAEQGDEMSLVTLGRRYVNGSGVPVDKVQAFICFSRVGQNPDAAKDLKQLKEKMTEAELAAATDKFAQLSRVNK